MTEEHLQALLADISCGDLRFTTGGLRVRIENPNGWTGRWWLVNPTDSESDVIRTAFKAAITWEEHEPRERFRYKGTAFFGPHFDVERLLRGV
ncbi:MAG: hypothetical protein FJW31_25315 [Acidobacteria bacterium]|nr:hypothetical protein [Acidobacteriota bacterium]